MLSSIHPLGERSRNNSWVGHDRCRLLLGRSITATVVGAAPGLDGILPSHRLSGR